MKKAMVVILMAAMVVTVPVNAAELSTEMENLQETDNSDTEQKEDVSPDIEDDNQQFGEEQTDENDRENQPGEQEKTDPIEDENDQQVDDGNGEETTDEDNDMKPEDESDNSQSENEEVIDGKDEQLPGETADSEVKEIPEEEQPTEEDTDIENDDSIVMVPDEYKIAVEGNDLILESIEEQPATDEILVQAATGHGTIQSDPLQENATVPNNSQIRLQFKLRSYGNDVDTFTILIYKSGGKVPLAKNVGTFSPTKGYSDYVYIWDTRNISKYAPGTYEVLCYSSYESAKGEVLNEKYRYKIHLEDYKLAESRNFVTRLYQKVLEREPDANGLKSWSEALYKGQKTGAQVTSQFIFSSEFIKKDLSDEKYVTVLYQAILGREPDQGGLKVWTEALDAGMTRWGVLKGFISSKEFTDLCKTYSITRGTIDTNENRDLNAGATSFVGRLYSIALGRKSDASGLNYWTGRIINKEDTPAKVAKGFIFSQEFANKKLNNTNYVKVLYKVFMNREADKAGLKFWVDSLDSGARNRESVFNGFANSKEFESVVASYNLK